MRVSGVLTVFALAVSVAAAADMPSGESLLQRYIEKSGGEEAYAKAKTMAMTGTVTIAGANITGAVSIYEQGEKSYMAIDIAAVGKIESGYDGDTAWENSVLQGARILEGEEKIEAKRGAALSSTVIAWRDVYKEANTTGSEDVNGKPAWKVEMIAKEGRPETFFFDKDSGLLVRTTATRSTPLGDIPSDTALSDYRPVDGILTPFTITENAMNQSMVLHFNNVSYNVSLPKNRFDLPDAVKALLSKKK